MGRVVLDVEIRPSGAVAGSRVIIRSLDDIGRSSQKMESTVGDSLRKLKGLMATVFSAYAIKNLSSGFLDAAVSVENYKISLNAVVKDIQKTEQIFKDLNEWAAINPIDTTDAIGAFVTLKTAAVDNTMEAVKAAADLATVMQASVGDVAKAIVTTETETLRNFGILMDQSGKQAIIQSGNVKVAVEKDIGSVRKGIIDVIQKQFGGSMQTAGDTWRGSLATMSGMWSKFQQDVMGSSNSGGPFSALLSGIRSVRDEWDKWTQTSSYSSMIEGIQFGLLNLLDVLSSVGSSFASVFSFAKDHVEGLTLALKTSLGVLVAYKAALLAVAVAAPLTAFLTNVGAWISLAPLAIKSFSEMASWLSLIGVSLSGPVALAIGAGVALFMELRDQMKRSAEKAKLLSDAMVTVKDKFSVANKSTLNLLEAEIDKTTKKIAELKEEMQEATKEALRLSTAQFMSRNGVLGGAVGKATEELRKAAFEEMGKTTSGYEALLQALQKRSDEIKKLMGSVTTPPTSSKEGEGSAPSSSLKSSESAVSRMVSNMRDQMKYLNIDGETFLGTLDKWMAKLKPLSDDWKKIADVRMEILGDKAEAEAERIAKAAEKVKEAQTAAAQGIDKFWSEMRWSHQEGFTSGDDLLKSLQEDFERMKETLSKESNGLIDTGDPLNWTDGMKARFSEIQSLASELASNQFASLNQQLENGVLTQKEWTAEVEKLKAKYGELPKVVSNLNQAQEDTKNTASGVADMTKLWANDLARGLADAIVNARDLGDALRNVAKSIASSALQKLIGGWLGFADGGVFSNGNVIPFARGGVVTAPTLFPMARGMGLMGEAGPEAVMPLKRGADGKLGVSAEGTGGSEGTVINNYYIQAADAQSFADMCRRNPGAITGVVATDYTNNGVTRKVMKGS